MAFIYICNSSSIVNKRDKANNLKYKSMLAAFGLSDPEQIPIVSVLLACFKSACFAAVYLSIYYAM